MESETVRKDRDFELRTKLLFDKSVAELDAETRSKLTQARYRALDERSVPAMRVGGRAWLPAGAVAAVAVLSVMLWQGQIASVSDPSFDVAAVTDLEILMGEEELEMIQELEFYAWLEEQTDLTSDEGFEDGIG